MPDNDFQERAEPACRERDRARLEDVSSDSGEQTEAPVPAGASVEEFTASQWELELLMQQLDIINARPVPTWPWRIDKPSGPAAREASIDAVIATQEEQPISLQQWLEIRPTLVPRSRPGSHAWEREIRRDWKERLRERLGRAAALGASVPELAGIYGVSNSQLYKWAQRPSVRAWAAEAAKTGKTTLYRLEGEQMQDQLEAIDARIEAAQLQLGAARGDLLKLAARVAERFPDDPRVQEAADRATDVFADAD